MIDNTISENNGLLFYLLEKQHSYLIDLNNIKQLKSNKIILQKNYQNILLATPSRRLRNFQNYVYI